MVICRIGSRLDYENVPTSDVFVELNSGLAIREVRNCRLTQGLIKPGTNLLSQRAIGVARKHYEVGVHGIFTWLAGWLGRKDSNLRMPESKSGALPLGDAPRLEQRPSFPEV